MVFFIDEARLLAPSLNVVNKIDGNHGVSSGSRYGNLDITTDDQGNVNIQPHVNH